MMKDKIFSAKKKIQNENIGRQNTFMRARGKIDSTEVGEFLLPASIAKSRVIKLSRRFMQSVVTPQSFSQLLITPNKGPLFYIPLKFSKTGIMWCGGAPETHWVTCHNCVTVRKTKQSLRSPCISWETII